jgi:release factor glutamine methyltransferase
LTPALSIHDAILRAREELEDVSDSPGSDAQLLLAHILNCNRAWILAHPEFELDNIERKRFLQSLERYTSGDPLPYILGWWEFYGRRFRIDESVLIPRPETETLVELALDYFHNHPYSRFGLDVGTGSGCISVSLLAEVDDLQMVATDISYGALKVARDNAIDHAVETRVHFVQMDLMTSLKGDFDLICSNLPYIATDTLKDLKVAQKEPWLALDGGKDGLLHMRHLLEGVPRYLRPGGCVFLEIEAGTGRKAFELAKTYHAMAELEIHPDLAGNDRVLTIKY